MNVMVINPAKHHVDVTFVENGKKTKTYRHLALSPDVWIELENVWSIHSRQQLHAIGVRCIFGGSLFQEPTVLTPEILKQMEELIPHAPMHVPQLIEFLDRGLKILSDIPIVLCFETAFFVELPVRERLYALDSKWMRTKELRRYGFHGLLHEAAAREFSETRKSERPLHLLSICLEPKAEIAAVIGNHAVMVSGGSTPVEGLPGQTSCGELDPSIALKIAGSLESGLEGADRLLSHESGLKGLVGRATTLQEVFTSKSAQFALAKKIMEYRILRVCGAGIAALNQLDGIVFSGRYASLCSELGPWLQKKLSFPSKEQKPPVQVYEFNKSTEQVVAELAENCASQITCSEESVDTCVEEPEAAGCAF